MRFREVGKGQWGLVDHDKELRFYSNCMVNPMEGLR